MRPVHWLGMAGLFLIVGALVMLAALAIAGNARDFWASSQEQVVIEQGSSKQLVYYWFKQRNRTITNEYVVKWYIFWDALTRRRTDGALVRLVTPVFNGEELAVTDSRLASFASLMVPILPAYVPD